MPIKNWSTTAASNTSSPPNGAPEGMAPSTVNDIFRQQMADHATQWRDAEWFDWADVPSRASSTTFKVTGDVTARYLANRRVKLYDASTLYATVVSSSYSAPDTTITIGLDSGSTSSSLTSVALAILSPTNKSAPKNIYDENSPIVDTSVNELLKFSKTSSAINEVTIKNAATGNNPIIQPTGDDSNPGLTLADKNGNEVLKLAGVASAVNEITVTSAATGAAPVISSSGGDTDIDVKLTPKGSGSITLNAAFTNLGASSSSQSKVIFYEQTTNGTNTLELRCPASIASNKFVTLPDTDIDTFVVQRVSTQSGAVATGTTVIPWDDTIPQNTEGDQYFSLSITPKNSNNILVIESVINAANSVLNDEIVGLFQDSTANAIAAASAVVSSSNFHININLRHIMSAGTTSSTTFKIRVGHANASTTTLNGAGGGRKLGGIMASSLMITEYSA